MFFGKRKKNHIFHFFVFLCKRPSLYIFDKREKLSKEDSNGFLPNFNNKINPIHTGFQDENPLTVEHLSYRHIFT